MATIYYESHLSQIIHLVFIIMLLPKFVLWFYPAGRVLLSGLDRFLIMQSCKL